MWKLKTDGIQTMTLQRFTFVKYFIQLSRYFFGGIIIIIDFSRWTKLALGLVFESCAVLRTIAYLLPCNFRSINAVCKIAQPLSDFAYGTERMEYFSNLQNCFQSFFLKFHKVIFLVCFRIDLVGF